MSFSFGSTAGASSCGGSDEKSKGTLFGASTASTTSPFGQPAATAAPASGGLFGSAQPASNTGGGLFGSLGTGASSGTSNLFGGGAAKPSPLSFSFAPTTPSLPSPSFGASTGNAGATNMSAAPATNSFGLAAGNTSTLFGNAPKPATPTSETPTQSNTLFGAAQSQAPAAGTMFGAANSTAATPAKPAFSFGNSTTPAGPPPANSTQTNNLFGATKSVADGAFKEKQSGLSSATQASGGNLFGNTTNTNSQPTSGNLFGAKPAENASSSQSATPALFGATSNATPVATSNLFSGLGTSKKAADAAMTSAVAPPKASFGFPSTATTSSEATPTSAVTPITSASSGGLFGGSGAPAIAAAASASNLFGAAKSSTPSSATTPAPATNLFGAPPATSSSSAAPAAGSTSNLFGAKPATATTDSTTTPGTAAPTSNLFGSTPAASAAAPKAAPATAPAAPATAPAAATPAATTSTTNPLGQSTAGPQPQSSRLKNKTMDDIITRWASDLSKYQKEFQSQATQVAAWDRLLVTNGDKIQKLYVQTFEAERAATEVERRLALVEGQQDELEALLDRYEKGVGAMFDKEFAGSEMMQNGMDQERERVYRTAEKVEERMSEMMRDLGSMIGEVNEASRSLAGSSKADDPLSGIVRVLNGHLSQLQWIDQNATQLQAKVASAQKASQAHLASGVREADAADDFYRSFMGGGRR